MTKRELMQYLNDQREFIRNGEFKTVGCMLSESDITVLIELLTPIVVAEETTNSAGK